MYRNIDNFDEFSLDEDEVQEAQKLQEKVKKNDDKIKVTTHIQADKDTKYLKSQFVIAFTENLLNFSKLNITKNQLLVVCYILEKMEYGNLISLNQSAIAKELEIHRSNVSRVFKQLREKEIIIADADDNLFMNSNLFSKGLKHKLDERRRTNLKKAKKSTDNFSNSFDI